MARLYGPGPTDPPALVPTGDLAGLRATDVEDRPVGELFGSLSEEPTGLLRYLDVALTGGNKHVLIPIGHARIDATGVEPRVRLRAATYEDLLSIPEAGRDAAPYAGEYHERLLETYGQLFYGERYYAHPAFDHGAIYAGASPVIDAGDERVPGVPPEPRYTVLPESSLHPRRLRREARSLLGRSVVDVAGETVGDIVDLLIEHPGQVVRYAVVGLARQGRRTALPVGFLTSRGKGEGEAEDQELAVLALTVEDIRLLPPCDGGLTRQDENRIRAAIEGRLSGDRLFQRPDFRRSTA